MTAPPQDKRYSVDEVAERLHVTPRTVRKLVKAGQLGCVQVTGHVIIFTEEQITEFEEARTLNAKPKDPPIMEKPPVPPNKPEKTKGKKRSASSESAEETSTWASRREEMRKWR